jgi:hypothetical protein
MTITYLAIQMKYEIWVARVKVYTFTHLAHQDKNKKYRLAF